jgi:hypothetical protein
MFIIPPNELFAPLKTFNYSATLELFPGQGIGIPMAGDIFQPEVNRIHSDLTGGIFHHTFQRKYHLRGPIGSHRARRRDIGVDRFGMGPNR